MHEFIEGVQHYFLRIKHNQLLVIVHSLAIGAAAVEDMPLRQP